MCSWVDEAKCLGNYYTVGSHMLYCLFISNMKQFMPNAHRNKWKEILITRLLSNSIKILDMFLSVAFPCCPNTSLNLQKIQKGQQHHNTGIGGLSSEETYRLVAIQDVIHRHFSLQFSFIFQFSFRFFYTVGLDIVGYTGYTCLQGSLDQVSVQFAFPTLQIK